MIKLVICDDEAAQRKMIVALLKRALTLKNIEYNILEFKNGEELTASALDYDIYFIDIKMDKLSGVEAAKKIRFIKENAIIIFITAFKDYVFDAFDVRAFNYILKPIDENRLKDVLYSALEQFEHKDKFILVKTNKQSSKILIKDIMYIEAYQRKLKIHTTYNIIEYYHKLSDIEKELEQYNFFRCHKSFIVNLEYVQSYDNTFITLKNSEKILVSRYKLTDFSKTFMYYLKEVW